MEQQSTSSNGNGNGTANQFNVQEILEMLERTKAQIILSRNKNVILLIGVTGSGKSTLAHFLVKDNTKLKSVRKSVGQYLLEDEEGKISKQTTTSETIIPQLVEDINTNTTLYDCPGFHDTRNTATDIVNAYSIHTILKHANDFKIIFVIDYHSVEFGADRRSFTELMENASKFIKNIPNYEQSIAAVITKVDNNFEERENDNNALISDNEVISGIEDFLRTVKLEIDEEKSYYRAAIKLINIFLKKKNNGNFDRLAIFRRPNKAGLVSENIILQNEKIIIQEMLKENISFTRKCEMDFGYVISEESKNYIFYLVEEINKNISNTMTLIGNEIIQNYKKLENEDMDLNKKSDQFSKAHLEFLNLKGKLERNVNLSEIVEWIKEILNGLNIQVPENYFDIISKQEYNLQFLGKVAERPFLPKSIELISAIESLLKYLNDSKEWYIFLNTLYAKLTEYDIQKDTSKLNINELQTLYNSWILQKVEKIGSDFRNLFEKIYATEIGNGQSIRNYSSIEYVKVDEIKLQKLLNILVYALENDVKYNTIEPTKILITGKIINLSKILHEILPQNIKSIDIFAAKKIFIDEDMNFVGEKRKIFIAAPEWQIINSRTINLNGANALQLKDNKANDGTEQRSKGDDGIPGLAGGPAGTIFGIGRHFSNLESLTITANGGDGSDGQNGGNGATGKNGSDPILPPEDDICIQNPEYNLLKQGLSFIPLVNNFTEALESLIKNGFGTQYKVFGSDGTPGGNGGNGGYYGEGGAKGIINIIDISSGPRRLDYNSEDGNNGRAGIGGNCGSGGVNGRDIITEHNVEMHWSTSLNKWDRVKDFCKGTQPSGLKGSDNINKIGYAKPESSIKIENIYYIIIAYKSFLNANLHKSINKYILSEFIQKLDENVISNIIIT